MGAGRPRLTVLDEEYYDGSTQTVAGVPLTAGDAAFEVDGASSFIRDAPHNKHDMGSVETGNLQRADQTNPVANTDDSDGAPLSIAGQILVSALSSLDLGEDGPVMVDISNFTTAKILDKQSSPFGVKYRCKLEPLWFPGDLVEKVQMGRVHIRSYENEIVRAGRLGTLRGRKRKCSQM